MSERAKIAVACLELAALAAVALVLGCAGLTLRGGNFTRAGHEPRGTLVARYVTRDCRDAHGARAAYRAELDLVRRPRRGLNLVERRAGSDSLVFENSFVDEGMRVFQLVLRGSSAPELLQERRVPVSGSGPGELRIADEWSESSLPDGGFRARLESLSLKCVLAPLGETRDAGASDARADQEARRGRNVSRAAVYERAQRLSPSSILSFRLVSTVSASCSLSRVKNGLASLSTSCPGSV